MTPELSVEMRLKSPDGNVREFNEAKLTTFDNARPRREAHIHSWYWAIPPSVISFDLREAFLA